MRVNAVIDDRHQMQVALVGRADPAREQLRHALLARGAALVFEGDVDDCVRSPLMRQPPHVLIVSLVSGVEDEIDQLQPLLDNADVQVVFDDGEASSQLSGWDLDRWARHLVAKVLGAPDVLPPRPEGSERAIAPFDSARKTSELGRIEPIPNGIQGINVHAVDEPIVMPEPSLSRSSSAPSADWVIDDVAPTEAMNELDFTAALEEAGVSLGDLSETFGRVGAGDGVLATGAALADASFGEASERWDDLESTVGDEFKVIKTREAAAAAEAELPDDPELLMDRLKSAMGLQDHSVDLPSRDRNRFDSSPTLPLHSSTEIVDDLSDEDLLALFASPDQTPATLGTSVADSSISEQDRVAWSSGPSLMLESVDEFNFDAIEPLQPVDPLVEDGLRHDSGASPRVASGAQSSTATEDWSSAVLSLSPEDQALLQSVEDEWAGMDFSPLATDRSSAVDAMAIEASLGDEQLRSEASPVVDEELARLELQMSALMGIAPVLDIVKDLDFPTSDVDRGTRSSASAPSDAINTPELEVGKRRFGELSLQDDAQISRDIASVDVRSSPTIRSFDLGQFGSGLSLVPLEGDSEQASSEAPSATSKSSLHGSAETLKLAEQVPGSLQRVVVLAASIGGPDALRTFLSAIASDFNAGFIVAQHLENGFFERLAQQLQKSTALSVSVPQAGMRLRHGMVWVIPSDQRFTLAADGTANFWPHSTPPRYRPCIDDILSSVADSFGHAAMAVVFSGMAADAVEGAAYLAQKGGEVWVQDPETCVVSSMVDGARAKGIVDFVGSPAELANHCVERFQLTLDSISESE